MGWAERLNIKSDWTLRNAQRIVAQNKKLEEKRELEEKIKPIVRDIVDEIYKTDKEERND